MAKQAVNVSKHVYSAVNMLIQNEDKPWQFLSLLLRMGMQQAKPIYPHITNISPRVWRTCNPEDLFKISDQNRHVFSQMH